MHPKHDVVLTAEEQAELTAFTTKGVASARELRRARVLLLAATGQPDTAIAAAVGCCADTVANIRRRWATSAPAAAQGRLTTLLALQDRHRPGATPRLDAVGEATLIALACSDGPEGRGTWTMQLLADRLVALGVVDQISDETVRRTLKKTTSSPGSARNGALAS